MKYLIVPFGIFVVAIVASAVGDYRNMRRAQREYADNRFGARTK